METYRERDEGVEVFGWTVAAEMKFSSYIKHVADRA